MGKVKIPSNVFIPMPVTIMGVRMNGKENYMTVGWVCRVNSNPPMLAMGIGNHHHTLGGVMECQEFSVNFPGKALLEPTDYVGIATGAKSDKSKVFPSFYGELPNAPLIKSCGLNLACKLVSATKLPTNTLIVGEIVEAYADEQLVNGKNIDFKQMEAFFLTMPDNRYWSFGEPLGDAWSIGRDYKPNES